MFPQYYFKYKNYYPYYRYYNSSYPRSVTDYTLNKDTPSPPKNSSTYKESRPNIVLPI